MAFTISPEALAFLVFTIPALHLSSAAIKFQVVTDNRDKIDVNSERSRNTKDCKMVVFKEQIANIIGCKVNKLRNMIAFL